MPSYREPCTDIRLVMLQGGADVAIFERLSHDENMIPHYSAGNPPGVFPAMAWLLGLGAFLVMATFARSYDYFPADLWASRQIQGLDAESFGYAARFAELAVTPPYLFAVLLSVYLFARIIYRGRGQALMLLVIPLVLALNALAKDHWVDRPEPSAYLAPVAPRNVDESFPSAHTITAVLAFGLLFYFSRDIRRVWLRLPLQASCLYGMIFGSLGGVYRGAYWLSDVYGAVLIGGLILVGVICLTKALERRGAGSPSGGLGTGATGAPAIPAASFRQGRQGKTVLVQWAINLRQNEPNFTRPFRSWLTALVAPSRSSEWLVAFAIYLVMVAVAIAAAFALITLVV